MKQLILIVLIVLVSVSTLAHKKKTKIMGKKVSVPHSHELQGGINDVGAGMGDVWNAVESGVNEMAAVKMGLATTCTSKYSGAWSSAYNVGKDLITKGNIGQNCSASDVQDGFDSGYNKNKSK